MSNEARPGLEPWGLALVVLLFAEHLLFGANRQDLALAFAVVHLSLAVALAVASRGAQPPRLPLKGPAMLMAAVFAIGLFSLLPLGPPFVHPLWTYVRALDPRAPGALSLDPVGTRVQLVKLAGFVAVFLLAASIGGRRDGARRAGAYLTAAGVLYGLWAAAAWRIDPKAVMGVARLYGEERLSGSFFSANTAGSLFACLSAFAVPGVLRPFGGDPAARGAGAMAQLWAPGLLFLVSMACLLLSASRGGLLALGGGGLVAVGLTVWLRSSSRSLSGGLIGAACLVLLAGVLLVLAGGGFTAERLAATDPLNEDRARMFRAYLPTIRAAPWLGYGLGAFPAVNGLSMTLGSARALGDAGAAHNVYLQWALQEGLIGALCMTGAVAWILAQTVRGLARRSSQQALGVGFVAAAAVFALHGLVDYALEVPSMAALFAALLGLGYGLAHRPSHGPRRRRAAQGQVRSASGPEVSTDAAGSGGRNERRKSPTATGARAARAPPRSATQSSAT